jgi:hypothetical protein
MPRDQIEEQTNIELSRVQMDRLLLINAGIDPSEAYRIAEEAAKDREAVETRRAAA